MHTTTMTASQSLCLGDIVMFGRPNGEKTRGRVIKIAPKSIMIETVEERGYGRGAAVGKKWRVAPAFVTFVSRGEAVQVPARNPVQAGPDQLALLTEAKRDFVNAALAYGLDAPETEAAFRKLGGSNTVVQNLLRNL